MAVKSIFGTASAVFLPANLPAFAEEGSTTGAGLAPIKYEDRDRNKNKDALICEDYWYVSGKNHLAG